nr:tyrosine-type recombinase/integrase [Pseudomonas sp.]
MTTSKDLRHALQGFHLDNPEATWEDIKGAIRAFACEALAMDHSDDPMQAYGRVYSDLKGHLIGHAMTAPLTTLQAKGLDKALSALNGAERRLSGDLKGLTGIIEELDDEPNPNSSIKLIYQGYQDTHPNSARASLPVLICKHNSPKETIEGTTGDLNSPAHKGTFTLSYAALAGAYMAEHSPNLAPATLRNQEASQRVLGTALEGVDMLTHSRHDMTTLKATLGTTRANSTVNKLFAILLTTLEWAVNTGTIERHYAKGLKHKRDAHSVREAFTEADLKDIMANAVADTSEASLMIQLAAITGARQNEVYTLTTADIREVAGICVMDINTNQPFKSLKNSQSARLVPLTGVLGFDLEGFLKLVMERPAGSRLFTESPTIGRKVNSLLRSFHSKGADKTLVFHSLRHTMATQLKAHGIPVATTQSILGHASGTLSYDLYGKGAGVNLGALKEAIEESMGAVRCLEGR